MLFPNETMEGLDNILLRLRKTSFGDNKHRPNYRPAHLTNKVEPICPCKDKNCPYTKGTRGK